MCFLMVLVPWIINEVEHLVFMDCFLFFKVTLQVFCLFCGVVFFLFCRSYFYIPHSFYLLYVLLIPSHLRLLKVDLI